MNGRRKRSLVWQFFEKNANLTAQCKECEKHIKTCGNTTNLKHHLAKIHKIDVTSDKSIAAHMKDFDFGNSSTPDGKHNSTNKKKSYMKGMYLEESDDDDFDESSDSPQKSTIVKDFPNQEHIKNSPTNRKETFSSEYNQKLDRNSPNRELQNTEHNDLLNEDVIIELRNGADENTYKINSVVSKGKELNGQEDEFTVYGLHVANELKKVASLYSLQLAKHKINQILFEATTSHLPK